MFVNKKFEWMKEYTSPVDSQFYCSVFKIVYWAKMYMKINKQGTQEDKYRLAKYYNESVNNCVTTKVKPFSFDFNIHFYHKYAVKKFIREICKESSDDDIKRDQIIQQEIRNREIKKNTIEILGYDVDELRANEEIFEIELDELNKNNSERNTFLENHEYPSLKKVVKTSLLNRLEKQVYVSGKGNIIIYADVHDKVNGFYTTIIYSKARKVVNGVQDCKTIRSIHYSGMYGVMELTRSEIKLEEIRTLSNSFYPEEKELKQTKPNISKIQRALGIEKSDDDDLNGDIF